MAKGVRGRKLYNTMGYPDDEEFFTNVDADSEDAIEAMNEEARERVEMQEIKDSTIPNGDD